MGGSRWADCFWHVVVCSWFGQPEVFARTKKGVKRRVHVHAAGDVPENVRCSEGLSCARKKKLFFDSMVQTKGD